MNRRSFNSVRSYFFREGCASVEREYRAFGGRDLDGYKLEDFREIWSRATSRAVDWDRQCDNRWDAKTRAWARPFRRIVR